MMPPTPARASRLRLGCMARPSPSRARRSLYCLTQSRGFRFGPWSASIDTDASPCRHSPRYRYMELLNRSSSWRQGSRDAGSDFMSATTHFWPVKRHPTNGAYVNLDDIKSWSDAISGLHPSRSVKSETLDHMFAPSSGATKHKQHGRRVQKHANPMAATSPSKPSSAASSQLQQDSFIDPITNRRAPRPVITPASPAASTLKNQGLTKGQEADTRSGPSPKAAPKTASMSQQPSMAADASPSTNVSRDPPTTDAGAKELGQVNSHEAKGKHGTTKKTTLEEYLNIYKKLDDYTSPFVVDDAVLAAHEAEQQIFAPRGKPLAAKVEVSCEDPTEQYSDLHKYGPVLYQEPEPFRQSSQSKGSFSYYGATPLKDSQGPTLTPKRPDTDGTREQPSQQSETPPLKRPDFDAIRRANKVHRNVASKLYTGLSCDGSASDTKSSMTAGASTLGSGSQADGSSGERRGHWDSPLESWTSQGPVTAASIRASVLRRAQSSKDERAKLRQTKCEDELSWDAMLKRTKESLQRTKTNPEAHTKTFPDARTRTSIGARTSGNYVRDYPEDFATSWSATKSPSQSSLLPKSGGEGMPSYAASPAADLEKGEAELSSMDESFPSEVTKLEPSLERCTARRSVGATTASTASHQEAETACSKEAQTPDMENALERYGKLEQPSRVMHNKAKTEHETHGLVDEASKAGGQPALYKILAYDAATGSFSMAKTTSDVEETKPRASPASILPRLSNPSKFLPYFARLHEQGYEIESGGGDVLVFRKVRDGCAEAAENCQESTAPVNPIDMMGRPVTGNFASPTGFVNYDGPAVRDDSKPSPPFRTSGGVAAAECQGERAGQQRGKRRLGRKLVMGTIWVTGMAYAAGVMGEYFATGGADGLGPTGL